MTKAVPVTYGQNIEVLTARIDILSSRGCSLGVVGLGLLARRRADSDNELESLCLAQGPGEADTGTRRDRYSGSWLVRMFTT